MKKNRSLSSMLFAASAALVTFTQTNAYADESYYIEIGKPSTVEETQEQWNDLSKKYKSMLEKLTFYPKSVINEDGETSNIIQAGPISEKEKAQKICNRFFAKGIQCFVLEGIEKKSDLLFAKQLNVDYVQGYWYRDNFIQKMDC